MELLKMIFGAKKKFKYEGPNAELVHAMNGVALQDNDDNRQKLYAAFLRSTLIVPTPELPANFNKLGENVVQTTTKISMRVIPDKQGHKVTPAFTDIDALRTWDPNTPCFGISAVELFKMVLGTEIEGVVINPFDPIRKMIRPGGFVNRAELDLLAKGLIPSHIGTDGVQFQLEPGQQLMIGAPAVPPTQKVIEALRAAAVKHPAIAQLYMFQMATRESSHTVIGISSNQKLHVPDNEGELVRSLGNVIQPTLEKGQSLDFMVLSVQFEQQIKAQFTPIYDRETLS